MNAPSHPLVEGRKAGEAAQSPASASRRAQLAPQVILEGRCAKGKPGIQDGSPSSKIDGRMGAGGGFRRRGSGSGGKQRRAAGGVAGGVAGEAQSPIRKAKERKTCYDLGFCQA
jgi:hypothetical protein